MASLRKRGNKFQAQVRRAGFQGKSKSFERLTEAKAWARSQENYFDRGEAGNQKPDDMPLASILSRYMLEVTPTKKSASGESWSAYYTHGGNNDGGLFQRTYWYKCKSVN